MGLVGRALGVGELLDVKPDLPAVVTLLWRRRMRRLPYWIRLSGSRAAFGISGVRF